MDFSIIFSDIFRQLHRFMQPQPLFSPFYERAKQKGGIYLSEAIIAAIITGSLSLAGVILTNVLSARKSEAAIRTAQAVTDTKLDELTREVREHNHFARRMPVVEEQIKVLNHRVSDLEHNSTTGAHFSS